MLPIVPIAIIVVGGVLLFPIVVGSVIKSLAHTRRLNAPAERDPAIARLEAELNQTREELHRLSERQQFVEQLLEKRPDPTALPR